MTLESPSGTRAAIAQPRDGAAAASNAEVPNPIEATTRIRSLTRPRAPVASAPTTEPTAIETASAV